MGFKTTALVLLRGACEGSAHHQAQPRAIRVAKRPQLQPALSTHFIVSAQPSKARAPRASQPEHKPGYFREKSPPGFLGTSFLGVHLCRPSSQRTRRPNVSRGFELLFTPCPNTHRAPRQAARAQGAPGTVVLYSTCGGQSSLKARQELSTKEFIVLPGSTWLLITHTPRSSWRLPVKPQSPASQHL